MWYYEINRKANGPVSQEMVIEELNAGRITRLTLVWRQGWPQWKCLGETELAALAGSTPTSLPPVAVTTQPSVILPVQNKPRAKLATLNKLFWWWFGLFLSIIPMIILPKLITSLPWTTSFICIFEIPLFASTVLRYILIYNFWQIIQDGFARTTPGKAIGLLFIPVFNLYWLFVTFIGLSKDQNSYINRHFSKSQNPRIRKSHPTLSLIFLLISFISVLLMFTMFIVMIASTASLRINPNEVFDRLQPYNWIILVFYYSEILLMIMMYFDFFLTSKSILKAEENQPQ